MFKTCEKNQKYKVNESGDILGASGKILKGFIHPKGYKHVFLGNGDCSKVHRLVAQAFIPNPENKPEVNHKDGNKLNNHVSNLEWATHSENMRHAVNNSLHKLPHGERSRRAILTQEKVDEIRKNYIIGDKKYGQTAFGRKFGVTGAAIWQIVHGNNWANV